MAFWAGSTSELPAGDIVLEARLASRANTSGPIVDGAGLTTGQPWANNRFVYEFSPKLQQDQQKIALFEATCRRLLENTALRCTQRTEPAAINDPDYVYVIDGIGDFSFVGRQGGKQVLGILNWHNTNIIAHEIKHALGWGHEQQHPDRDLFVEILFENIPPEHQENFRIYDGANEGPYDFDSVMHYYPSDFARPTRKSIRVKAEYQAYQAVIGQRDHLSATDLQEIRDFYGDPSVEWCGVRRKPPEGPVAGCSWVCQLESDPGKGAWMRRGSCERQVADR